MLPTRPIDARATIELGGQANPYRWVINGAPFGQNQPLEVVDNDRLLLEVVNTTTRAHPVHLHGHTFALDNGLRKDTLLVPPSSTTARVCCTQAWACRLRSMAVSDTRFSAIFTTRSERPSKTKLRPSPVRTQGNRQFVGLYQGRRQWGRI